MSAEERQTFTDYVKLVGRCMNKDADPCDDFLEYACGKFNEEEFDKKNGDWPPSMFGYEKILECVFENGQISDTSFEKVRNLIISKRKCLAGGLKEHLKSEDFIEFCGGLPAFNSKWSENDFDWARALGILHVFQCNPILSLHIEFSKDTREIFVELDYFAIHEFSTIDSILGTLQLDDKTCAHIANAVKVVKENLPKDLGEEESVRSGKDLHKEAFNFRDFIETALCIIINESDVVHLGKGVVTFITFLSGQDRRLLANYLTFLFARDCSHIGAQERDGQIIHFIPILISRGFATYFNEEENRKRKYLKERFGQSFALVEHSFPANMREEEQTAFRTTDDAVLKFVEEHYNLAKVRAEYEDLEMIPNDFYQNLYNISNHGIPKSLKTYKSSTDKRMNLLVLAFLRKAAVHWKKPMVFHFSGQELANWLSVLFKRNEEPRYVNCESEEFLKVLDSQVKQFKPQRRGYSADEIICGIEAIDRAYSDYKIWMSENEETVQWQNDILSKIDLDCHKVFFVAFAQHWICCTDPKHKFVLLTLMNFEDFSKIFACTSESLMNPKKILCK